MRESKRKKENEREQEKERERPVVECKAQLSKIIDRLLANFRH